MIALFILLPFSKGGIRIGRIRQGYIKRTAKEVVKRYGAELPKDFKGNRTLLDKYVDVQSKFLKNKIAGYITHLLKKKGR